MYALWHTCSKHFRSQDLPCCASGVSASARQSKRLKPQGIKAVDAGASHPPQQIWMTAIHSRQGRYAAPTFPRTLLSSTPAYYAPHIRDPAVHSQGVRVIFRARLPTFLRVTGVFRSAWTHIGGAQHWKTPAPRHSSIGPSLASGPVRSMQAIRVPSPQQPGSARHSSSPAGASQSVPRGTRGHKSSCQGLWQSLRHMAVCLTSLVPCNNPRGMCGTHSFA